MPICVGVLLIELRVCVKLKEIITMAMTNGRKISEQRSSSLHMRDIRSPNRAIPMRRDGTRMSALVRFLIHIGWLIPVRDLHVFLGIFKTHKHTPK
jgi:hypothetical protein